MSLEALKPFLKRLLKYFDGDVTVILFGSYAKGDFNKASDYDLVLISNKLKGNPLERTKQVYKLNEEFLPLDILAFTQEEFLKAMENLSPTALDAIEEGKVLHDNGFYDEARKRLLELKEKGLRKERYWVMI
ncbi:MAG: nucleotidyltransferase domain-containing protein [Candidatus Bathyarchaeota archaeon]